MFACIFVCFCMNRETKVGEQFHMEQVEYTDVLNSNK